MLALSTRSLVQGKSVTVFSRCCLKFSRGIIVCQDMCQDMSFQSLIKSCDHAPDGKDSNAWGSQCMSVLRGRACGREGAGGVC